MKPMIKSSNLLFCSKESRVWWKHGDAAAGEWTYEGSRTHAV